MTGISSAAEVVHAFRPPERLTEEERVFGAIAWNLLQHLFCELSDDTLEGNDFLKGVTELFDDDLRIIRRELHIDCRQFRRSLNLLLTADTESSRRELSRYIAPFTLELKQKILGDDLPDGHEALDEDTRLILSYRLYVGYRRRSPCLLSEREQACILSTQAELGLSNVEVDRFLMAIGRELIETLRSVVCVDEDGE